MKRTFFLVAVALSLSLAAAPAEAKPGASESSSGSGSGSRGGSGITSLSLWGVFDPGPWNGYGAGFRLTAPLAPQGLLHARIRDELYLEFGADFLHYNSHFYYYPGPVYWNYSWNGVLAECGLGWNFWITPQFALYPKIDVGWRFGWYSHYDNRYGGYYGDFDGVFLQLAAGMIYRLPSKIDLRLELGSDLVRLGVGFPF